MVEATTRLSVVGTGAPDLFYKETQCFGYVACSVFKLDQIQRQHKLIKPDSSIFDLGCALDDGTFYFDEKFGGGRKHQGSLSTSSSVVRGITSFAAVTSGKID
ncbi:hypothetical protein RYX36_016560, partial [Vicia faba]